jgi:hypothetical protein
MPFPPEETTREPTEPADAEDTPWIVYPLLCLSLAISPLGAPVIFLLLSWLGYCEGALGSGIDCSMPLGGEYFKVIGGFFELSLYLLIGFFWGILALVIFFFTLHSLIFAIIRVIYAVSRRPAHSWPAPALSLRMVIASLTVTWTLTFLVLSTS